MKHLYEFEGFRLDLQDGVLLNQGQRVRLEPKDLEILLVLVENHGRTVGKDELLQRVWPDTFVEEGNLARHVSTLRQILGEHQNGLQYIETIPKRGYRFIAPVQDVDGSAVGATPAKDWSASRAPTIRNRATIAFAAVIGVLLMGAFALLYLRRAQAPATQYIQLTNYADSASSPALSPDGRMLAFIRGDNTFYGPGEIYLKLLPEGESFQLTQDGLSKMSPTFSADGTRIAYTTVERGVWNTWTVPVPGGSPQRMLPNASGLTWIGRQQVMFSEVTSGLYMKIVTASESRADERDVYRPPASELSMAHRSYLSPDRKWALIAEMDPRGWLPCRLVPFDGSSLGKQVGPVPSKCTSAAWTADGNWMYFAADSGNGFHIWRQHFPNGGAEQITSGATEEEGIALDPDSRSFIASVGAEQSTAWLHEPSGDRQISSEGYAYTLSVSPDGSKVYYLLRAGASRAFVQGELWVSDMDGTHHERLLPGFLITRYDISRDGKRVVFAALDASGKSSLWLAQLDRRSSPRHLSSLEAYRPFFGANGDIFFLANEGNLGYVYRMRDDGTAAEKVTSDPVLYLIALSPDGLWVIASVAYEGEETTHALVAYSTRGEPKNLICSACAISGPRNPGAPMVSWTRDQKSLYLKSILGGMRRRTFVIPLRLGEALPKLPPSGLQSDRELLALPGAHVIDEEDVFPGPSPIIYAFTRKTTRRNLYRITLP